MTSRSKVASILREAKDVPCTDCGIRYPYYIMDFDHLYDKRFNIGSDGVKFSREDLYIEIAKCEVVCSNCHRTRTWQRKTNVLLQTPQKEEHLPHQ